MIFLCVKNNGLTNMFHQNLRGQAHPYPGPAAHPGFGGSLGGFRCGVWDYHDFHLGEGYKSNTGGLFIYNLGVAPSQYSSDHQDYEPFLGSGIPT